MSASHVKEKTRTSSSSTSVPLCLTVVVGLIVQLILAFLQGSLCVCVWFYTHASLSEEISATCFF